jgi:hypothetical protein
LTPVVSFFLPRITVCFGDLDGVWGSWGAWGWPVFAGHVFADGGVGGVDGVVVGEAFPDLAY